MTTTTKMINGNIVAIVKSNEPIITDPQSALDFMMTVQFETDSNRIAVSKDAISEAFFKLTTGLAGEVLQKFVNYNVKLAVFGDFSGYTSKALKDFIYESNNGNHIFFAASEKEAVERLGNA